MIAKSFPLRQQILTSGSERPRKYRIPPFIDLKVRREVSNNTKIGVWSSSTSLEAKVNLPIEPVSVRLGISFYVESYSPTNSHSPQRELHSTLLTFKAFFWGLLRWLASDFWGRLAIRQGFSPRSDCLKWHPGSGRSCIQESWPSLRHQSSWDSQCTLALLENHWAAPLAERKKNIKTTTNKTRGEKSVIQPEKTERGEKYTKIALSRSKCSLALI